MFISSLIFSMFLVYGCAALLSAGKHASKKVARYGKRSTYDDDYDPWNLRKIKLRNERFQKGPLWVLKSEFDGKRFHAVITCTYHQKDFDVYADSIPELEDKIDAEYIRIMNQYESLTGHEFTEFRNGKIYGWYNGERVVKGIY